MYYSSELQIYKSYLVTVKHYKLSTVDIHIHEISIFLSFFSANYSDRPFSDLIGTDYLEFRFKKPYKRTYTNKIIQYLLTFYKYLLNEGRIAFIPGWLYEKARAESRIPNVLSMFELHLIENSFSSSETDLRDNAIIESLLSTGLRISELLGITLNEYKNESIIVNTKGDKQRMVILNEYARKKIDAYLKIRKPLSVLLFCNKEGKKLTVSYIDKMLLKVCKEVGIKKRISAHSLRHTYASLLMEGGANIIEVRDLLGHSSVTSTEIYTKTSTEHLRKELQRSHPAW